MTYDESRISELKGLCKWLKEKKGITQIDMMDLIEYVPEYEKWLEEVNKNDPITNK